MNSASLQRPVSINTAKRISVIPPRELVRQLKDKHIDNQILKYNLGKGEVNGCFG